MKPRSPKVNAEQPKASGTEAVEALIAAAKAAADGGEEAPAPGQEGEAGVYFTDEVSRLQVQVGGEPRPEWKEAEDLSDLPEALRMAIVAFGLKRDHVLGHRLTDDGVVLVTAGGKKLAWPADEGRILTPAEKGEDVSTAPRFWPQGFLDKGAPRR